MADTQKTLAVQWGSVVGAGALFYQVTSPDGTVLVPRSNVGVVNAPAGSKNYSAVASWDDATDGIETWDDGATFSIPRIHDSRIDKTLEAATNGIIYVTGTPLITFDDQNSLTSSAYNQTFVRQGWDSTGWTEFAVTLKSDPDTQDDSESLATIKVSNPPAASDGLIVWKGQPVATGNAMQASGTITVALTGVDTSVSIRLSALAMEFNPSPSNAPYRLEIDRWLGGDKQAMGIAGFVLSRSVRRNISAP